MSYYVPIFAKIVDSSLWAEPDFVVKVFITMLAKKDKDNVCRGSAFNIARWSNKTEEEVLEALKILASPDTKRVEPQPYEGRRIEKADDGWMILNGEVYQRMMKEANRKQYLTEKKREERARGGTVPNCPPKSPDVPDGPPTKSPVKRPERPDLETVKLVAAKIGLSAIEAEKFFNYYESNGWKTGSNPIKSWTHALNGWKLRNETPRGSNKPNPRNFGMPSTTEQASARIVRELQERGEAPL